MVKFDHRDNLPDVFRTNRLAILPVTRGDYRIGPFDLYSPLRRLSRPPKRIVLSGSLETLTDTAVTSETIALNLAFQAGITKSFLGGEDLHQTAPGRMGATPFQFRVRTTTHTGYSTIATSGVQIEIDATYETWSSLVIVEAKLGDPDDFLVRQLYYPYRHFIKAGVTKPIRPLFFTYSEGVFTLREFRFNDRYCYNSLAEVKAERFTIDIGKMTREELAGLMAQTVPTTDLPDIPFPQANDIKKVVRLCENIMVSGPMSKTDVERFFHFTDRQADYYLNAAKYLGLILYEARVMPQARLTEPGTIIASTGGARRDRNLAKLVLKHAAFRETLHAALLNGSVPDVETIRTTLLRTNPGIGQKLNGTFRRRASTVRSWVQWMLGLIAP